MTERELTQPYRPNLLLKSLYRRFFDKIQLDPGWAETIEQLSERGTVIYVLRNLNWLDFFALDHLTKKHELPQIRYTQDLQLGVFNPMGKGWLNAIRPKRDVNIGDELEHAFDHGGTAALFLKRPPNFWDALGSATGERGLNEGDELVRALFEVQRRRQRPLLLVPLVFLWSKFPDKPGLKPVDFIIGPRGWPSPIRSIGQFMYNYRHVALRLGEPLDVQAFLASSSALDEEVRVRRITYAMLRRLERERRSITGPAQKSPERVRQEIVRGPKLRSVIDDLSNTAAERRATEQRATSMLKELQATPTTTTLKGLEVVLNWALNRIYRGIDRDSNDIARLRQCARDGSLIFLPSHKSHIDYLILSYVCNEENLPLPRIAAGDNLNFMPIGPILRRGGAFFIRRTFKGDRLYAAIVDAYVRRLIRDGSAIELFLEGTRSRNGKLLEPKFGLLNMIVDATLASPRKKVHFVPVSIGYERVIEARAYEHELTGGEKQKEDAAGLLKTPEVLRHRYGRINLQVGQILKLGDIKRELGIDDSTAARPAKRRALVTRLGNRVMDEINRVTAVTPGALTALALLSHRETGIEHAELVDRCQHLLDVCLSVDARVSPTLVTSAKRLRERAVREALAMFLEAQFVESIGTPSKAPDQGSIYRVVEARRLALDTSKNIIVHFFTERSLVAASLDVAEDALTPRSWVKDRVQRASKLFKHEFRFRADAPFDEIFDATVKSLVQAGHLREYSDGALGPGPGSDGWSGERWLDTYAAVLQSFVEGYVVAARALTLLLKGPAAEKEVIKQALALGHEMYLKGEIQHREATSKPVLQNAFLSMSDFGYVRAREGKLVLSDTFNSLEAVAEIEHWILSYAHRSHDPLDS